MCVWWGGGRGRRGAGEWSLSAFLRGEMEGFPNTAGFCKRNILSFLFFFFLSAWVVYVMRGKIGSFCLMFSKEQKKKG